MKLKNLFILLFSLSVLIGCKKPDRPVQSTGTLTVQLADAPFPHDLVAEANVTVFKVEIRNQSEEGFLTLTEEEFKVNLLDLVNGVTETLVNNEIPIGIYDLIRIYVKDANVILTDGTIFDLKVPSGEQTGIKVNISPSIEVAGGLTTDLLLDFDVSKSFVVRGNVNDLSSINGFIFKPTLKAVNLSNAGVLSGTITTILEEVITPLEGVQLNVIVADTVNTSTFTDINGEYTVLGLNGGTYGLNVEFDGYDVQSIDNVNIVPANETTIDVVLVPIL